MSKSYLEEYTYQKLFEEYPYLKIKQNIRPPWFLYKDGTRLELDFYIPELEIAIEVQGVQHFEFVEFFHSNKDGFELQKEYDEYKKFLCRDRGIKLYEVIGRNDVRKLLNDIKYRHQFHKAKRFYSEKEFKKWRHRNIKLIIRSAL